jgi:hypothetical protein
MHGMMQFPAFTRFYFGLCAKEHLITVLFCLNDTLNTVHALTPGTGRPYICVSFMDISKELNARFNNIYRVSKYNTIVSNY